MSIQKISLGLCAAFIVASFPFASHAYFTTNQIASTFNKNTALFAIQYDFGLEKNDIYMPIMAERNLPWENDQKKVGYTLRNDKDVVTSGTTSGLVLSSAPIVDGMYKIAKGTVERMTLFVLLTTPSDAYEMDYALQVDALPYYMDKGEDELMKLQLNPSELTKYVTKEVELNTGNFAD
jgi:hypothetical protein